MIYLNKILPLFILPVMIVIQLIFIGIIKNNNKFIYLAIGLLYILSTPIFSNSFFFLVEGSEHRVTIDNIDKADVIVVLGGMLTVNKIGDSEFVDWGDPDRFFGGLDLFEVGKAPKLIFSGAKLPWIKSKKNEGEFLKEFAISKGISNEKIIVTKEVQNTKDEALAIRELIGPNKNIILVTSAFHMYRAKMLFERQGINVIPYKVNYTGQSNKLITILDFLPSANSLAKSENGFRELLGIIFYSIF